MAVAGLFLSIPSSWGLIDFGKHTWNTFWIIPIGSMGLVYLPTKTIKSTKCRYIYIYHTWILCYICHGRLTSGGLIEKVKINRRQSDCLRFTFSHSELVAIPISWTTVVKNTSGTSSKEARKKVQKPPRPNHIPPEKMVFLGMFLGTKYLLTGCLET